MAKEEKAEFKYLPNNGEVISIPIRLEHDNIIKFSREFNTYTADNKNLVDLAGKVKSAELFDTNTVDAVFNSYTQFRPFDYQKENVKTMLNVFEGRGCFGDQVGLGKTVEALMSAHIMYECGAIRNVVIVATSQTAEQWASEIKRKFIVKNGYSFDSVFEVRNDGEKELVTDYKRVKSKINDETVKNASQGSNGKCPIYIISGESITGHTLKHIIGREKVHGYLEKPNGDEEVVFEALNNEYQNFNSRQNGPYEFLLLNGFICPAIYEIGCDEVIKDGGDDFEYYNNLKMSLITDEKLPNKGAGILAFYTKVPFHLCCLNIENGKRLLKFLLDKFSQYWDDFYKEGNHRNYRYPIKITKETVEKIYTNLLNGCGLCNAIKQANGFSDNLNLENLFNVLFLGIDAWKQKFLSFYAAICEVVKRILQVHALNEIAQKEISGYEYLKADLLIIDEVHRVASNTTEDYDPEKSTELINFVHHADSKYCVLLSATPIRKGISDAAQLACIAKKGRYGKEGSRVKYYYSVVCGVNDDERENALGAMVAKKEINRLNGIINSTFTRSRVKNVNMISAEKETDRQAAVRCGNNVIYIKNLRAKKSDIANELLASMSTQYYIEMCMNGEREGSNASINNEIITFNEFTDNLYGELVVDGASPTIEIPANWVKEDFNSCRFLNKAFDMGAMQFLATNEKLLKDSHGVLAKEIYERIDWTRPEKLLLKRSIVPGMSLINDIVDLLYGKVKYSGNRVACGRVVIYASTEKDRKSVENALKEENKKLEIGRKRGRNIVDPNRGFTPITGAEDSSKISMCFNEILLANGNTGVGTNLNEANTLILMQMDVYRQSRIRIAEPLDIEQWIGRIYRTGQKRNCEIIMYPRSAAPDWTDNNGLLQFYLDILDDREGLDLFGSGDAEVGFVAPIVVDYLHMVCKKCLKGEFQRDDILHNATYNKKESNIKVDSKSYRPVFTDFVRLVYEDALKLVAISEDKKTTVDGHEALKVVIRRICKAVSKSTDLKAGTDNG